MEWRIVLPRSGEALSVVQRIVHLRSGVSCTGEPEYCTSLEWRSAYLWCEVAYICGPVFDALHNKATIMEKRITLLLLVFFIFASVHATYSGFPGEKPLTIYPNPAIDQLNVEFTAENDMTPEIKIFDLTGKMVRHFDKEFILNHDVFKADLDISDLNTGIYFIKVIQGKKTWSEKLVVK